jgi:C1A family cysteine protease
MSKFALLAGVAAAQVAVTPQILDAFQTFQSKYAKTYESNEEWAKRAGVFAANLARVAELNNEHVIAGGNAVHGVTKFMDLTQDEFAAMYLTYKPTEHNVETASFVGKPLADDVDWRTKNAVTAVKDQGQCGSCWAFSATEAIESYAFLAGQKLQSLSPQQINSCDKVDLGCNGGNTESAYEYVVDAGGIETEASYPYKSGSGNTGVCKFNKANVAVTISGYKSVPKGEDSLQAALNDGPVSVCLAANAFQTYNSGILKICPGMIDHCVQAVGYSTSGNYWIVRNSWAKDWGEEGYIRLEMGKNICKVANDVTFPTF